MRTLLVVVVILAACGDDPMQKPDAAVQQQMDAPNPPPPRDAAIDSPPLPSVREGVVIVAELKGNDPDTTATASIMNGPLFGPSTAAGGCLHYSSPEEDGISAGTISVTGTAQAITIAPSTTTPTSYDPVGTLPADLFDPGDTISISAAGAAVPAFSGTVMAPAEIANAVMPTTISRANPPTITWTAGTSTEMWLWVAAINGTTLELLWCRTPDDGSFAIPAAGLAQIPMAATSAIVFLWRTNQMSVTPGGWDIDLVVSDAFGTDFIQITQ